MSNRTRSVAGKQKKTSEITEKCEDLEKSLEMYS